MTPKTDEDGEAITILLHTRADQLSEWETQFLESLADQEAFTDKQRAKLDQIWARVVG